MNKILTIALVVILAIASLLLGKVWLQNHSLDQANDKLNKELMQTNLEIGRAHTKFGNAHKTIGDLEGKLQREINDRKAAITRIGELQAKLDVRGSGGKTITVEKIIEVPAELRLDPRKFYWSQSESQLAWLGETMFFPFKDHRISILTKLGSDKNGPRWDTQYDLTLRIEGQLVETLLPSGAINNYITLWEVDLNGKRINKLQLTAFEMTVDDQRKARFFWWVPRLDIGASVHLALLREFRYGGSLGISFMGFGLDKNSLSWRFFRLSAEMHVQESIGLGIAPVLYNLGDPIPLISNVWIGPNIIITGNKAIGLTIGAVL